MTKSKISPTPKIPVTILTGYLGAGKTHTLAQVLAIKNNGKTAAIINEFGENSLDHLLVSHIGDQVSDIPGGCACCETQSDLADKMLETASTIDIDKLIIETSGVSDAASLVQNLWQRNAIRQKFQLANIVTVLSTVEWQDGILENEALNRQLVIADIIILSKIDRLAPISKDTKLAQLKAALVSINPTADIWQNPLSNSQLAQITRLPSTSPGTKSDFPFNPNHAHNYHSLTLEHHAPILVNTLEQFLDKILSQYADNILRIKGLAMTVEKPEKPFVVQVVKTVVSPQIWLENWPIAPTTQLTVIYTGNVGKQITALFHAFNNIPATDQPDRAALTDNPLSITGMGKF